MSDLLPDCRKNCWSWFDSFSLLLFVLPVRVSFSKHYSWSYSLWVLAHFSFDKIIIYFRIMIPWTWDLRGYINWIVKVIKLSSIFKKALDFFILLSDVKVRFCQKIIFSYRRRMIFLFVSLNIFDPCGSFTKICLALVRFGYKCFLWLEPFLRCISLQVFIRTREVFRIFDWLIQKKLFLKFILLFWGYLGFGIASRAMQLLFQELIAVHVLSRNSVGTG